MAGSTTLTKVVQVLDGLYTIFIEHTGHYTRKWAIVIFLSRSLILVHTGHYNRLLFKVTWYGPEWQTWVSNEETISQLDIYSNT